MSTPTRAPERDPGRGSIATGAKRPGDGIFRGTATAAGTLILLTLAAVAAFLMWQSLPAFTTDDEIPRGSLTAYIGPLLFGTVLAAVIALVVATPVAVGIGLFISHFAPRRAAQGLGYLVDLLAAVPSIVYGIWGAVVLSQAMLPIYGWLADNLGFIPLFAGPASASGRTIFTAGLVLAVMVLPIITALARDIFLQTPRLHEEAALALGATRWEMIRYAVLPYARSGVVSAAMLGLGRALGETMAVALVLSVSNVVTFNLISNTNPGTIAANIALQFPEAAGVETNVLIASGLALFVITFLVNFAARWIVARSGVKA
ncbi:phosphate ABC transporter permease subunit PstC [Kineococcus siccus]|uniref:phosphate ABC transporter permease subunit PstC n=1 Tax=Kineococcus siccus TaxID=2696567 RepID=UPI00196AD11F